MPPTPESRVYILGAGCSKDCDYPLGPQMRADLESYLQSIDPLRSPRLKAAVGGTGALFGGGVDTNDAPVQKLNLGQLHHENGAQKLHPFRPKKSPPGTLDKTHI